MPKWAHPILPRSTGYRQVVGRGRRTTGTITLTRNYMRQGSTYTTRVPVVCRECNSGWMSAFEEEVRPHLERMIAGKRTFLHRCARDRLAEYLTYKLLVLDWMGDDPILPKRWATEFYEKRKIPELTRIYLSQCSPSEWNDIETIGCGLAEIDDPRDALSIPPNTKSFAVGFGDLFVFAVLSSEVDLDTEFDPLVSVKLWPFEPKLLIWPPHIPITGDQASYVSKLLTRIGENPFVIERV